MILLTLALVFVVFALVVVKFSDLADDITNSNNKISNQQLKLKEQTRQIIKVGRKVIRSNLRGCQGQNEIRTILRRDKKYQIDQSHSTDYEVFFPGTDPQVLHDAIHKQNVQLRKQINKDLKGKHCHEAYPTAGGQ